MMDISAIGPNKVPTHFKSERQSPYFLLHGARRITSTIPGLHIGVLKIAMSQDIYM